MMEWKEVGWKGRKEKDVREGGVRCHEQGRGEEGEKKEKRKWVLQ